MFRTLSKFGALFASILAVLFLSGCGLCGCDKSDADALTLQLASTTLGAKVDSAGLTVDTHAFSDDEFTTTAMVQNPPQPDTSVVVTGTFTKSGDTVTFKINKITPPVLSPLIQDAQYTLSCKKQDGKTEIVLKRKGVGQPALTFVCH